MGEWVSETDEVYGVGFPTNIQADGYRYWAEVYNLTEYPLWRVNGLTMTPITGFTPDLETLNIEALFSVGDMVILSAEISGVLKHWKIEGDDAIPLEPEFGPVPFFWETLFTRTESGTIFSARNDEVGRELWFMDESGYSLVSDVNPGFANSHPGSGNWPDVPIHEYSSPEVNPDTLIMFSLNDGVHGVEPWGYDTSNQSLSLLADLVKGPDSSRPRWLGRLGGFHYFNTFDRQIYKSDGQSFTSIEDDFSSYLYNSLLRSTLTFGDHFYTWWNTAASQSEQILRVSVDDAVNVFDLDSFASDPRVEFLFPHDGEIQIVTDQTHTNDHYLKIAGDQVVRSEALAEVSALDPRFIAWSGTEVLFHEIASTIYQWDFYCLINGESIPVWRKPEDLFVQSARADRQGDWVYLVVIDVLTANGLKGGKTQLWGMKWPEGCQEPWVAPLSIKSGFE